MKKKIILSHRPGTGGDFIASILFGQNNKILDNGCLKIMANFKNQEFDYLKLDKKKLLAKEILNFLNKHRIITIHTINIIKNINNDTIKIRTDWKNEELGRWFAYRDLLTTNVIKNLPHFYNKNDMVVKKIMDEKIDETEKIKIFFENHYRYGGWYDKDVKLDCSWKVLNIDNILNNFCFIKDLEIFCKKNALAFNKSFAKIYHNKWLKKNNKKKINLEKYVSYFKENKFIELILEKVKNKN